MDKIKFAQLISFVSMLAGRSIMQSHIEEIDTIVSQGMPQVEKVYEPATQEQVMGIASHDVAAMLQAMHGSKKIEAIKLCRKLTGLGLKEAKDMIEAAMYPINN